MKYASQLLTRDLTELDRRLVVRGQRRRIELKSRRGPKRSHHEIELHATQIIHKTSVYQNLSNWDNFLKITMTIPDEFDIIVCGGGSCGCVVAGRSV